MSDPLSLCRRCGAKFHEHPDLVAFEGGGIFAPHEFELSEEWEAVAQENERLRQLAAWRAKHA